MDKALCNMFFEMILNPVARNLVVLVLALTLTVSVAPAAMAGTAMINCNMGSMDVQAISSPDQHGLPMQKQQMPVKDTGSCCTTACAGELPQVGYSPVLASMPAVPGWSVQAELVNTRSPPELPPPIAIL
jgi:hypothetical protein